METIEHFKAMVPIVQGASPSDYRPRPWEVHILLAKADLLESLDHYCRLCRITDELSADCTVGMMLLYIHVHSGACRNVVEEFSGRK